MINISSGTQAEKEAVADDMKRLRCENWKNYLQRVCIFDPQQVIYTPKSARSELFYKSRLSNIIFTIHELASRDGWCFLSHELGHNKKGL